jgi:uncharacterized NAD-dependent epimerase/dehydratase family protein
MVDKGESCWEWTGARNSAGYGYFAIGGRRGKDVRAHRYAFELMGDAIPSGMDVDHRCHNKICVNPAHLRLATNKQNSENLRGAMSNSKTGVRGVWRCKTTGRWIAMVGHNGKQIYVGRFDTIEEAHAAVTAKRNELFTHNDLDRAEAS